MLGRVVFLCAVGLAPHPASRAQSRSTEQAGAIVIHAYHSDLAGMHAGSAGVKLRVGRDSAIADEPVLFVEYPTPTNDPAARDVRLDANNRNWTRATAISFRVKPAHAMRISVSFIDRNHVVYTAWTDLAANMWQPVRIAFSDIRPNPYFQPPDVKTGSPIDISDVGMIAFSPQDRTSGGLAITQIVLLK